MSTSKTPTQATSQSLANGPSAGTATSSAATGPKQKQTFPLEPGNAAIPIYTSEIEKPLFVDLVQKNVNFTTLLMARRGTDVDSVVNNPVTVLIGTSDPSQPALQDVVAKTRDICKQFSVPIAVEAVFETLQLAARTCFSSEDSMALGESTGHPGLASNIVGTMGGYLVLNGDDHVYGLTNDHVIRPWEYPDPETSADDESNSPKGIAEVPKYTYSALSDRSILSPSSPDLKAAIKGMLWKMGLDEIDADGQVEDNDVLVGNPFDKFPFDLICRAISNDQYHIMTLTDLNSNENQEEISLRQQRVNLVATIASKVFDSKTNDLPTLLTTLKELMKRVNVVISRRDPELLNVPLNLHRLESRINNWRLQFMKRLSTMDAESMAMSVNLQHMLLMLPNENRILGVRAWTSGIREPGPSGESLDWGLVKIESRATNRVTNSYKPISDAIPNMLEFFYHPELKPTGKPITNGASVTSFGRIAPGMTIFKNGRTTGTTVGKVNALPSRGRYPGPKMLWFTEWIVIGVGPIKFLDEGDSGSEAFDEPLKFIEAGDSGSWALDEDGKVVGLFHAGRGSKGIMTDIHVVMAEIVKKTGRNPQLLHGDAWAKQGPSSFGAFPVVEVPRRYDSRPQRDALPDQPMSKFRNWPHTRDETTIMFDRIMSGLPINL